MRKISSTNRSNARDSHIADYYVTPPCEIINFLSKLDDELTLDLSSNKNLILDPCSGGDKDHEQSYPLALKSYYGIDDSYIRTIDLRKDSLAQIKGDYLETALNFKPYLIISNPPFNKAIQFIKKALNDVRDDGYVIMLLRLNFLGSISRKDFFDGYMPKYIYVHHKRMSFTDTNKTDSIEYCHMVWKKNDYPTFAKIRVI